MKAELMKREGNAVTFEIKVEAVEFDKATEKAYKKTRSRYNIPGFRKGKAPRKIIELNYGKGVFFNDALDILLPEVYPVAVDELGLSVVSQPSLDIKDVADNGDITLIIEVDVKPEFEIADYKGVEIEKIEEEVNEEKIEEELNALLEKQSRMVEIDGAIEKGHTANIDFVGTLDGVAFEGGSAEGVALEIGSGTFIPGFEDQLEGKKAGEEVEVNVTFPEDYQAEDLAGKAVVFNVKINNVTKKELPELNDEFAQDTTEFDTLEELKNDIKARLQKAADENAKQEMKNEVVNAIAEKVEVEIPASMIDSQLDRMLEEINMQLSYQGWSLEKFAELSGQSVEDIRESRREEATKLVKNGLVVEKIAEIENMEVTEEDIDKDMENFAKMYNIDIEKVKSAIGEAELEGIKSRIRNDKTVDMLLEAATIK